MPDLILIADDDPDIVRFVELNLTLEKFEVITASDGETALALARERRPDLVILDVMMPKMNGFEVCEAMRADRALSDVNIIMLTAKSMSADRVVGLTAGADDYVSKPFDPTELLARVKNALRRSSAMRSASPLTGLPGNIGVDLELSSRLSGGDDVALLWIDIDNFKAYNDAYGFGRGDGAIRFTADVLREAVRSDESTFLGHIGGDDFVVIADPARAEALASAIIERFDQGVPELYDDEDAARGSVTVRDRKGTDVDFPLITLSIGVACSGGHDIGDHRELIELATEMKSVAKHQDGSYVAIDRRTDEAD